MDYFSILNLNREPFSNSPDPDFFFQSRQHVDCLQKLEMALRLKRGLNIVVGAVGAGKTTLCRTLLNKFASDDSIETHLILDPSFNSPVAFLDSICAMIVGKHRLGKDPRGYKEQIKHQLYQKGVDKKKTVILVIDEGQKLPVFCLEILREFLNYETNNHKLLQIVLFAQEEIQETLDRHANLADRVNLIHYLGPMSLADTRQMINFRIKQSSSQPSPPQLFTNPALRAIYRATGGYPRKIINLCHQCILALIVQNRTQVNWRLVRTCQNRSLVQHAEPRRNYHALAFSALVAIAALGLIYITAPGWLSSTFLRSTGSQPTTMPEEAKQPRLMAAPISPPEAPVSLEPTPTHAPSTYSIGSGEAVVAAATRNGTAMSPKQAFPITGIPADSETIVRTTPSIFPEQVTDIAPPVPPSLLGALTVKRNDTLGEMIKIIYGEFRVSTLKAVLEANPHISDANAIRVGDTIAFPAIPTVFDNPKYALWWLKVGETGSLDTAFRQAIKASAPKDAPLMRVITKWAPKTGLEYGIYVAGYFFNPSAAESMMARLPLEFNATAEIISGWADQTILFSDPFLGKGS